MPRSTATPSLSRNRIKSGGASTGTARPTLRNASREPRVRRSGSPGPSPTMRSMTTLRFADGGLGLGGSGRWWRAWRRRGGAGRRTRERRREEVGEPRVGDLDVRLGAQAVEEHRDLLLLLLLRDRVLNLRRRAGQRRLDRGLLFLDLDDVPAERRLHRRRDR